MTIESYDDINGARVVACARSRSDDAMLGQAVYLRVVEKIAEAIAAEYITAHGQELLAAIDPVAVSNLAVADASASIRRAVNEGSDRLVREMQRPRTITTPGIFGNKRSVIR